MISDYTISAFLPEHVDQADVIEKLSFSEPWSRKTLECMAGEPFIGFSCLDSNGKLVGYCACLLSADEGEIANIATHPDCRRQGIATLMLDYAIEHLKSNGAKNIYLEVRASNIPASALYIGHGFVPIGIRKKYYSNPTEDAVLMRKTV